MVKSGSRELLKDKRVSEEIHRHLWIESEKAGYDIGFEKAAEDWLKRFSGEWVKYHEGKETKAAPDDKSFFKFKTHRKA